MFSKLLTPSSEDGRTRSTAPFDIMSRGLFLGALFLLVRSARLALVPVLLIPTLWGTAFALWQTQDVSGWLLAFFLIANGSLCAGLNLLSFLVDYQQSLRPDGRTLAGDGDGNEAIPLSRCDGFELLRQKYVHRGSVLSIALIFITVGVLTYLLLGVLAGWPLWFFGGMTLLTLGVTLVPSIRYSRRLWSGAELSLLVGLGILPVIGAYYAQTGSITNTVLFAAILPSILAWLTYLVSGLTQWRRDWRLRRGSLVVALGPERFLDLAAVLGVAAFTSVLLLTAIGVLPFWSMLVLGALPLFLSAFARSHSNTISPGEALVILDRAGYATILAGLLWIVALWLQ